MTAWIDVFLPTFGLIALGFVLRARFLKDERLWAGFDELTFYVLLPALLAYSISTVSLGSLPVGRMIAALWGSLVLATAVSVLGARMLGHGRAAMTSIVQGGIRFNTYAALGIASGLYGPAGLAIGGVVAGLIVMCAQTILALVFVLSDGGRPSPRRMVVQALTNPLLLGCLVGFAFSLVGGMPPGLGPFARALGQASLAVGLLCVGAGLSLGSLREQPGTQIAVGVLKLVGVPLLVWTLARLVGLPADVTRLAVLIMAMPTATTAYVMAKALGGDARLMAAIITLQHLAAVVTLPVWAALLA